MSEKLTHFDDSGRAHMVDVGDKDITRREAVAIASLAMSSETLETIRAGSAAKGDVLGVARVAGIMGSKKTADLIPLCHPIGLQHVAVEFSLEPALLESASATLWIRATARCDHKTGVEMEALVAATSAALTVYDMCKAIDRAMALRSVFLARKSGGRSGHFEHPERDALGPARGARWI